DSAQKIPESSARCRARPLPAVASRRRPLPQGERRSHRYLALELRILRRRGDGDMKITGINTYALRTRLETPFAFSQGWVNERGATLVEIETDAGLIGWGEALCQGLQPPDIAAAVIKSSLAPILLARDPRDIEALWHQMYTRTRDFGGKGAVIG